MTIPGKRIPILLALVAAAPALHAQAPAANPVDPASVQALRDMGTYLQTLKHFRVSTEVSGERVLADGQKLQHTATADVDVARPDKLRARMASARSEREIVYDGSAVTLYIPAQKYYSTVPFTEPLTGLIAHLERRYGVEVPLADLFVFGTPEARFDRLESAMNAGQDFVGGALCNHYAFRQGKIDWQIWIETGAKPLPRKIVVTNRDDEARPQSVSLIDWNLKTQVAASAFRFVPPKGSKAVELRALDKK